MDISSFNTGIIEYDTPKKNNTNKSSFSKIKIKKISQESNKDRHPINEQSTPFFITEPLKCSKVIKHLDRYYLEFTLTKDNKNLYELITNIDDHSINSIFLNSKNWFGIQIPKNIIDDYHKSILRIRRSGLPVIKLRVSPSMKSSFEYKDNMEYYEGQYCELQIKYTGLRFYKRQFIGEWLLTGLSLYDNKLVFHDQNNPNDQNESSNLFSFYDESEYKENNDIKDDAKDDENNIKNDTIQDVNDNEIDDGLENNITNDIINIIEDTDSQTKQDNEKNINIIQSDDSKIDNSKIDDNDDSNNNAIDITVKNKSRVRSKINIKSKGGGKGRRKEKNRDRKRIIMRYGNRERVIYKSRGGQQRQS